MATRLEARLQYAGGHPEHPESLAPADSLVVVDDRSVMVQRKEPDGRVSSLFIMPIVDIFGVRISPDSRKVDLSFQRGDVKHSVRFQAAGPAQLKDAEKLCSAIERLQKTRSVE